jgi:hypothetical protein
LSPGDGELARAIQALEIDVAPDSPLPELLKPIASYEIRQQEGEPHFDESLRKAAYLRAKLISVLNAPAAWPTQALPTTLHQMTLLRQKIIVTPMDYRWDYYEINDYHNKHLNPWHIVSENFNKSLLLRNAVSAEVNGLSEEVSCDVFKPWFIHAGKGFENTYALQRLLNKKPLRCGYPDWEWLKCKKSQGCLHLISLIPPRTTSKSPHCK